MTSPSNPSNTVEQARRSSGAPSLLGGFAPFIDELEKRGSATWSAAILVAVAAAGRGVTPGFEAGWTPLAGQAVVGLLLWLFCTGVVWNVAHRILGLSESFLELARVFGLPALPLLGLWLNVIPSVHGSAWTEIALHATALVVWIAVTRAALQVNLSRALLICTASIALGLALVGLLGILLVGSPAFGAA